MRRKTGRWHKEQSSSSAPAGGYGFINPAQGGEDVFVHYSVIQADGFRTLKEGDRVEYSVVETPKGYQAKDVVVLN
ncbi:cold shock domain-containing protein [Bifidobacterium pseudolongum]|uniref:Cold shock domain-containing protein n=1 Tax=Bifidobacterium pseudolongum TaxID=1694 RepID=A0A4V6RYX9_9BIFI|nr:cold shock domain-containing protein [Bifidobacterium pseudolongum]